MNKVEINRATDSTRKGVLPDLTCDGNEPTDVLRIYLASITGLDKTKVRKRWQPKGGRALYQTRPMLYWSFQ